MELPHQSFKCKKWVWCGNGDKKIQHKDQAVRCEKCQSWKRIRVHSSSHFKGYPTDTASSWWYNPPCFLKCKWPRPHCSHCCTYTSNKGHTKKEKPIFTITDIIVAHSNFVQNYAISNVYSIKKNSLLLTIYKYKLEYKLLKSNSLCFFESLSKVHRYYRSL